MVTDVDLKTKTKNPEISVTYAKFTLHDFSLADRFW